MVSGRTWPSIVERSQGGRHGIGKAVRVILDVQDKRLCRASRESKQQKIKEVCIVVKIGRWLWNIRTHGFKR